MTAFAWAGCFTAISSLVFGFFVFFHNPTRRLNQLWLAFTLAVALWGGGSVWIGLETDAERALWAWRVSFALSVVWIPILFYHFVCIFCHVHQPHLLLGTYAVGVLFVPWIVGSDSFFAGVRPVFAEFFYPQPGPLLFACFTMMWLGLTVYSHILLLREFRRSAGLRRMQIIYFFIATALGYTGGSLEFLPMFGLDLYPWGHFAIPLYPVIMSYAIIKYRLMDISIVLEKSLSYLLLFSMAVIPAFGGLLWGQKVFFGRISYTFSATMLAFFHLFVLGAYSLKIRAEAAIGRTLFKRRYEVADALSRFSQALVTILDFSTLTREIVRTLVRVLTIQHATLFVWDKGKGVFAPIASTAEISLHVFPRFSAGDPLPLYLQTHRDLLVREELEYHSFRDPESIVLLDILRHLQAELCLPFCNTKGELIGFCLLGPHLTQAGYAEEDLQLLRSLGNNAAIALDNALLYEELKQAHILMQRSHQLRSLEIMAGGFAHEVRNPLTSIKTFIQLAPHRVGDYRFLREFGRVVGEDVARIERLTQEILEFSRSPAPQLKVEDLNAIVESCLYSLQVKLAGSAIHLKQEFACNLPPIQADRQQLQQVFSNLLLNALEAIDEKKKGVVRIRTFQQVTTQERVWVVAEITDTGEGIPPQVLDHVFDPFFTTKHQSREREGTGLGLTIAHQIVEAHRGAIDISSEVGKGTTVVVRFPAFSSGSLWPVERSAELAHTSADHGGPGGQNEVTHLQGNQ
ncbi:MAG: hypothetical protein D6704_03620 [Nitrospirae bacterium]|nr:MAG: hypothetical protein D6704_03620 [Nitrospirota bacterium]